MLKRTWRRSSSPAVWSIVLTLGVPALVQAQLFPLAPIQRERVPCPMEDPVYGLYRQQYFGYFPTCWRAYPPGWGCPSPEAPDVAAAFAKQKRDPLPEPLPPLDMEPGTEPEPGGVPPAPRGRGPAPPLPTRERSPFELDTPPGANPAAPGGGATATPPQASASARPRPRPDRAPTADEKSNEIEGTGPLLVLPDPVEAAPAPAPSSAGADSARLEPSGSLPAPVSGPGVPAGLQPPMPGPNVPRPVLNANLLPPPTVENPVASPVPMPVQAPQRRGPISSLFNGMTSWLRR